MPTALSTPNQNTAFVVLIHERLALVYDSSLSHFHNLVQEAASRKKAVCFLRKVHQKFFFRRAHFLHLHQPVSRFIAIAEGKNHNAFQSFLVQP